MFDRLSHAGLAFLAMLGLTQPLAPTYQGYGEADYVRVASSLGGTLETLNVVRGQQVHKGDTLFALDHTEESTALTQALAQAERADAVLADLTKGKRAPELDSLIAQRDQANAALKMAQITYDRDALQIKTHSISQAVLDNDKALLDQAKAHLAESDATLATGRLSSGRDDAIRAAEADVTATKAARDAAQWRLDQKTLKAPTDGFVFDTLYRAGEFIPAGQPVVALLPPANITARFFVTEPRLASLPLGTAVHIQINGPTDAIPAHVTYVAPDAEFSPPQLYNRDNRERLLYMLEATPDSAPERLHPGQPVDVVVDNAP